MLDKGTTVAGYRIDGALGEGGMGVVYRATQLSLNRSVALKILSSDLGDDESFRERFRREGLLQAAIDHPHIVTVYDTGETEHGLFLAMRMVRGPTLKDMILSRELDPGRTLRILTQVAEALNTAHDVGLTHRDIKPQNILIGSRDHAYLADFGLTKAPDEAGRLTATGQFVGTIDYVSPEQIQGEAATPRSDIYALTGVLYECLVGAVAFPKPTEAAVVYAHIAEPPPRPTADRPELPAAIDEVVAKGMAKDPSDRYQSAGELLEEARRAFGEGVGATPGPISSPEEVGIRGNGAQTEPSDRPLPISPGELADGVTAASPVPALPTTPARVGPPPAGATVPAAETPEKSRPAPIAVLAAALTLVAVVAGFVVGGSGGDSESRSGDLSSSASAGNIGLSFPSGWKRAGEEPKVAGISFSEPIVLRAADFRGARLVAGQVDGVGPTLLPETFLSRLPRAPSGKDAVRLGKLQAFRYADLAPRGAERRLTVYAAPTTEDVATVVCMPGPERLADFARECERVAATLELNGSKALPLGPRADYAKAMRAALERLDRTAATRARRLRAARTQTAQATAATSLSRAYRSAARSISAAPDGPLEREATSQLIRSLRRIRSSYSRAARAARSGNRRAYASAGRSVKRSRKELRRAFAALRALGYTVK